MSPLSGGDGRIGEYRLETGSRRTDIYPSQAFTARHITSVTAATVY